MESKVSDEARERVMNALSRKVEDHKDVKVCNHPEDKIGYLEVSLKNLNDADDTYDKIESVFEWVKNERQESFLYNQVLYTFSCKDRGTYGLNKTHSVTIPVKIIAN